VQNAGDPGVLGIVRDVKRRRARAHEESVATIRSARFRNLILNTAEWIEVGPWTKSDDDLLRLLREQPIIARAPGELAIRRKKLKRRGSNTLKELSPLQRHALRIAAKKFRYALEFFSNLFPGKTSARRCSEALLALKELQDALGGLNDIAIREQLASRIALSRRFKSDVPGVRQRAFAAGLIAGSQEAHAAALLDAAESAYTKFLNVKVFWR
jgi:CHAD domain-containing protein